MARVLIVGCGCRGRALGAALRADGHAVRGTSRDPGRAAEIEAAGLEAAVADPDRLGTIMLALPGVSVVCWLLAGATGPTATDLHDARLRTLLERLVDTPVRGFVYEAGPGAQAVHDASARWHLPVEVVPAAEDPSALRTAVARLL